ncbi:putative manganese-transporting ATPase PDR2 [Vitis vinifera]|uniref:Putative manganese-transporting ATPase PDR2 n=1 Tax=Vitis vinifera TaxID=29760 RepID=A0A438KKB3_VITVI|nr:putative manganese-transporting ATPase PDR2 [Vitis vinifera]
MGRLDNVGDPLEKAALKGIDWSYKSDEKAVPKKGSGQAVQIVKRHHFASYLKRMSVVVRVQEEFLAFVKETKMKEMSDRFVRSLGVGRNLGWVSLDARALWEGNCEEGFVWVFSGLYGPLKGRDRRELWEELVAVKGLWNEPWCIVEDFNVVRFPGETSNGRQMSTTMREFSSFIDEFKLVDPPLGGGAYTWSGGEGGLLKAWLDRFLFSGDWEDLVWGQCKFFCQDKF